MYHILLFRPLFEMGPVFGRELFIRFTVLALREHLSICVCASCPFKFEGWVWNWIVLISYHCLSFYFEATFFKVV